MQIYGLQKLTLLDYPGQVACTLFTGGCNFRCPFCHNSLLVTQPVNAKPLPPQEVENFLQRRRRLLDGVCITGGEPLLQSDLLPFLHHLKEFGYRVKLDTNGSFPTRLQQVIQSGTVDYVAMDIKNDLPHYAETVGLPLVNVGAIQTSIQLIQESGLAYEFRTTIVQGLHTPERIAGIGAMIPAAQHYFLQNFVDSGQLLDESCQGCTPQEMRAMLEAVRPLVPAAELRGL